MQEARWRSGADAWPFVDCFGICRHVAREHGYRWEPYRIAISDLDVGDLVTTEPAEETGEPEHISIVTAKEGRGWLVLSMGAHGAWQRPLSVLQRHGPIVACYRLPYHEVSP